jgi:hypothetical protein
MEKVVGPVLKDAAVYTSIQGGTPNMGNWLKNAQFIGKQIEAAALTTCPAACLIWFLLFKQGRSS